MKYIFLDFNGTIIDDVDLCLNLLNEMLSRQHKKILTKEEYRNVFTFPVKKYYELAGIDFKIESFEKLADEFISKYQPLSLTCGLFLNIEEAFSKLKEMGYHLVILSASEKNNLLEQCHHYQITSYFDEILGIDNIHAESKIGIAKDYMKQMKLQGEDILFIGDTLHDVEVAREIGAQALLVSCGHQSIEVLKSAGVPILDSVLELPDYVQTNYLKTIVKEDFWDLELNEFPYDRGHTALGEYHCIKQKGVYGNWYDPICLHQWRSLDGSWLVTSDGTTRYMEQNRGDNSKGAFKNVYCCLVHDRSFYAGYTLEFNLRIFELASYCGMAFHYVTSRVYDFVGILGDTISLIHRNEETFTTYASGKIKFDDLKTYHIQVNVGQTVVVFLDGVECLRANIPFVDGGKIALVAKSACRYSSILVQMTAENERKDREKRVLLQQKLEEKRKQYPKMNCIHKIDLKNFGSGRQLRIRKVGNQTIFLLAQHQKRMIRDSFARLSCLTCFDLNGTVLWQKGEPHACFDNAYISCDLPFQIADINHDGKFEVIYSMDFEIIVCDLLTGLELKRIPTPVIYQDELVKNEPFYRLNVDAIRVADFEGLGYKGDFIVKDRYQNIWAFNHHFEVMWRYHHKNTGHFPYIEDFDGDGKDEMFVGYDLIDHDGTMIFSLPMDTDHTDEIIYARLHAKEPKRLILASGNEGMNIVNLDGTIYCHNEIGHAQRVSVAKYIPYQEGLQIMATAFWGSDGIICIYDCHGKLLKQIEQRSNGNVITPVLYDGKHILCLLNASEDGGLVDGNLDKVVRFPIDGHPVISTEVYDIDGDGIDEIICFDMKEMWIYKAESYSNPKKYQKYTDDGFSNYRGEYLLPDDEFF